MSDNDQRFAAVDRELLSWPGVTKEPGRFNSTAYKLGRREIGHVHGNRVADFGFPRAIRDELVAAGRAAPHQAGIATAVSYHLGDDDDIPRVIELFRLNYDRLQTAGNGAEKASRDDGNV